MGKFFKFVSEIAGTKGVFTSTIYGVGVYARMFYLRSSSS